jgi:hypothetical protein
MAGEKKPFLRLPLSVKPVVYDLYLKPDLEKFTFEGKETISINVSMTSYVIYLTNGLFIPGYSFICILSTKIKLVYLIVKRIIINLPIYVNI